MSPIYTPFIQKANLVITDPLNRLAIMTSALALALSNIQHLPTTQVEDPSNYFKINVVPGLNAIVSEWNESMVLDPKAVIDQARTFWLVRYTAAFPLSRLMYAAKGDFFSTVFGVYGVVSPALQEFLDGSCKLAILTLANEAVAILHQSSNTIKQPYGSL